MQFVADESVDVQIVTGLRQDGFNVFYIAETSPSISDTDVLAAANRRKSVLITADKDFGDLVYRQHKSHNQPFREQLDIAIVTAREKLGPRRSRTNIQDAPMPSCRRRRAKKLQKSANGKICSRNSGFRLNGPLFGLNTRIGF